MVLGAYVAGVGINALAPARGGDVVKIATVRNRVAGSSVPALTSSLLAETVFDFAVATGLLTWAYGTGRLPALPDLPNAPAFEWSFIARHTQGAMMAIAIAFIAGWLLLRWLGHHVRAFWLRIEQGLVILRQPRRYFRCVVALPGARLVLPARHGVLPARGVRRARDDHQRAARARGRVDLDAAADHARRRRGPAGAARDRAGRAGVVVVAARVLGRRPGGDRPR